MIIESQFRPAYGLSNPHLQTLFPYLINDTSNKKFIRQTLELDDGDFIDLTWSGNAVNGKPVIIIFHGLESSIDSHYAPRIMQALRDCGWTSVLMHFRGCSGRPNRLARSYHSGETGDARYLTEWLKENYPDSPLLAIGYSLGGNMLLKLQSEYGTNSPIEAAVSVCAPIQLDLCADRMNQGFSRFYQRVLINCLIQKILDKSDFIDYETLTGIDTKNLQRIKTFWEFDDMITAPLHGFEGVDDYYRRSNSRQYLKNINKPALIIHALDDPFMTPDIIPDESELSDSVEFELCLHGGHIGFISGNLYNPVFWLQARIPDYFQNFL